MKTHNKIIGNISKKYIELNINFSRWLIGFCWLTGVIVIELGPLAILFVWGQKYARRN